MYTFANTLIAFESSIYKPPIMYLISKTSPMTKSWLLPGATVEKFGSCHNTITGQMLVDDIKEEGLGDRVIWSDKVE